MIFNKNADYSDLIESIATYFNIKSDGHVFNITSDNKSMSISFADSKNHFILFTITEYGIAVGFGSRSLLNINTTIADMTAPEYFFCKTFKQTLINLTIKQ